MRLGILIVALTGVLLALLVSWSVRQHVAAEEARAVEDVALRLAKLADASSTDEELRDALQQLLRSVGAQRRDLFHTNELLSQWEAAAAETRAQRSTERATVQRKMSKLKEDSVEKEREAKKWRAALNSADPSGT